MSRVRPILFNTEMVRAILDGKKMVTRRVAKKIPVETHRIDENTHPDPFEDIERKVFECHWGGYQPDTGGFVDGMCIVLPPFQLGDILYVRETFCPNYFDEGIAGYRNGDMRGNKNAYRADYHKEIIGDYVPEPKWKPSIHMPKRAARIWLKVTDVRVERLQDITAEQAIAEGIEPEEVIPMIPPLPNNPEYDMDQVVGDMQKEKQAELIASSFGKLWDSTIKKSDLGRCGWNANPFVWVIEFERCDRPEGWPG